VTLPGHEPYLMRVALSAPTPPLSAPTPPLSGLRAQIDASLAGLGADLISDVQLVVTELVTNAYVHGKPPVRFELCDPSGHGVLRVEVTDAGPDMPEVRHPDVTESHGRGLLLVRAYTTRWGVTTFTGGKTVWAEFPLPR